MSSYYNNPTFAVGLNLLETQKKTLSRQANATFRRLNTDIMDFPVLASFFNTLSISNNK